MKAEALIAEIDAVPVVDYCRCGRPRSEHTYWVDRIYDYNGYRCPGSLGGDYRHDAVLTKAHHARARAATLAALLQPACSDLPAHGFGGHAVPGGDS